MRIRFDDRNIDAVTQCKIILARIEKYLNTYECVNKMLLQRMRQELVKRSMFNYGAVTLQFGDFVYESKTAIKSTLLKAQPRELIRMGYYSPAGCRVINASPCTVY